MSQIRKSSSVGAPGIVYDMTQYRTRVTSSGSAGGPEAADQAAVSDSARELSRARSAVDLASDVRPERIRALRVSISEGKYQPDPREIAKRILERGF